MIRKFVIPALALLAVNGCSTVEKSAQPQAHWINNMHKISDAHLQLMPLVADPVAFAEPRNKTKIAGLLKNMAEAATEISTDPKAPNADPLIDYTASRFASEARQAYGAFSSGDSRFARYAVNRASDYCIACHTRADRGARDFDLAWTPRLQPLTGAQKVEFLLANRQYASALAQAKLLAADMSEVKAEPRAWQMALAKALAMTVRVNQSPRDSEDLARRIVANKGAPYYVRSNASAWLKDIARWKRDRPAQGLKEKLNRAVALTGSRAGLTRDAASLIPQLRASALLHEVLEEPNSPTYAEALLYAGVVSESLTDIHQGTLDQYYYETCIKTSPHSDLAERCYSRLESSVFAANPLIDLEPDNEQAVKSYLGQLRLLAEVKDPTLEPAWMQRMLDEATRFRDPRDKRRDD